MLIARAIEKILSSTGVAGVALAYGSWDNRDQAIAHGSKPASAKSKNGHRAETIFFAKTGTPLFGNADYTVSKFVVTAIIGSKSHGRGGALDEMSEEAPAPAPAKATGDYNDTITATIVDTSADTGAEVREAAKTLASIYRGVTSHNSRTNASPEVREANLNLCVPGTTTTYKRCAQLARAIDPTYNV